MLYAIMLTDEESSVDVVSLYDVCKACYNNKIQIIISPC